MEEVEGVGVMKDQELLFEEIEVSHTLGGEERSYTVVILVVIHTQIHQSRGRRHTIPGWVVITDVPVYMCERGGGTRGGYGLRSAISVVIHTSIHFEFIMNE